MLIPELLVKDLRESLRFWCTLSGFRITHDHREEAFAFLQRDDAQVMIEELIGPCRKWLAGALEWPFERGIDLEIKVNHITPILEGLAGVGWPLIMPCEEKWYWTGSSEMGRRQFVVQDPDGYWVRFVQPVGVRLR